MYDINDILGDLSTREALIKRICKEEGLTRIRGDVSISLYDGNGIKEKRFVRNLVVSTGLYHMSDRLEDSPDEAAMSHCAIGNDNTTPIAGDTALTSELGRVALTSKVQGTGGQANQLTYSATFPAGTGTGTIVEAGIFNASSAGIMLARSIFAPIVKTAGDAIDVTWVLTITAA